MSSWRLIFVQAPDIYKEEKTHTPKCTRTHKNRTPEKNDQKRAAQLPEVERTGEEQKEGEKSETTLQYLGWSSRCVSWSCTSIDVSAGQQPVVEAGSVRTEQHLVPSQDVRLSTRVSWSWGCLVLGWSRIPELPPGAGCFSVDAGAGFQVDWGWSSSGRRASAFPPLSYAAPVP